MNKNEKGNRNRKSKPCRSSFKRMFVQALYGHLSLRMELRSCLSRKRMEVYDSVSISGASTVSPRRTVTPYPSSPTFLTPPVKHESTLKLTFVMPTTLSVSPKETNGRRLFVPAMARLNGLLCLKDLPMLRPLSNVS